LFFGVGFSSLGADWIHFGMKRNIIILGVLALLLPVSFEILAQDANQSAVVDDNGTGLADDNGTGGDNEAGASADWWGKKFLNNTIVDWLIALGIALGAIVLARALYWAISNYVKKIAAKTESKLDDIIIDMIDETLVVAGGAAGIWVGFTYLDFSISRFMQVPIIGSAGFSRWCSP
jgi:divalent metal cation (Fe/Co/Zn/Cd) transporter